jgi:hypothetical protein
MIELSYLRSSYLESVTSLYLATAATFEQLLARWFRIA